MRSAKVLEIHCPFCGPRDLSEFRYGGQAHIARPEDPAAVSDADWARYLFTRRNPKGVHRERWVHAMGCRRWFYAVRHTVTDQFWATYRVGEAAPLPPEGWDGLGSRSEFGKTDQWRRSTV